MDIITGITICLGLICVTLVAIAWIATRKQS